MKGARKMEKLFEKQKLERFFDKGIEAVNHSVRVLEEY